MGKSFLPDDVNQSLLFPPSLHDWLPERSFGGFSGGCCVGHSAFHAADLKRSDFHGEWNYTLMSSLK